MMNPASSNLRSHNCLKNSSFNQIEAGYHLNPVSSRHKLTKKLSLNSKNQSFCALSSSNSNLLLQNSFESRTPRNLGNSTPKHDMVISLGSKTKQIITHGPILNIKGQIANKIDYILIELEKHNKRLATLEQGMVHENLIKQSIMSSLKIQIRQNSPQAMNIYKQIAKIKNQLQKMVTHNQFMAQIQNNSIFLKQSFLGMRYKLQQQTKNMQNIALSIINKQAQLLSSEMSGKTKQLQGIIKNHMKENLIEVSEYFYETGSFVQTMIPLLKNPEVRLKFTGKVSLIDVSNNNPQSEHREWNIQNFNFQYMIDKDGCLLDRNQQYLVDNQGKCIQLNNDQIQYLLSINVLQ